MKIKQNNHFKVMMVIFSLLVLSAAISFKLYTQTKNNLIASDAIRDFNEQVNCLTENIYYEAGNESYEGKLAVAQVTMNRTNSGKFPTSVCEVVNQKQIKNGKLVCQFSWVCTDAKTETPDKYMWYESLVAAKKALTEPQVHDKLYKTNALYYHAVYVKPRWTHLTKVAMIGHHIFYKEKNDA